MKPDSPSSDSLFRKAALEHMLQEEDIREPLRVSPPWTWSLVWVLGILTLMALAGAVFGKVEILSTGRGTLRPVAGVRLLQAQVGGTVGVVYARSGDFIRRGQPIATINDAQIQSSIFETDRQLSLLQSEGQGFRAREDALTQDQIRSVREKIAAQKGLVASYQSSVAFQQKNVRNIEQLIAEKLEARFKRDEAVDQLNNAIRQEDMAKQQLVQLQQELASLESSRQRQIWQHSQELNGVQSKREALESNLRQTEILAPVDGFLDAMVARHGDVVQAGQTVAKLIPEGSPLQAVVFLPEKDRPDVRLGATVDLELDAYPFAEFGTLKGRVLRIGSALVSPYEVQEVMGEGAKLDVPSYRVDIELLPDRSLRAQGIALRPGMQLQARFILRKQRLIVLVLAPLRRWLE